MVIHPVVLYSVKHNLKNDDDTQTEDADTQTVLPFFQEDIVDRVDESGMLLHPNFRRCLVRVGGYSMWRRMQREFDIDQHVTMAPLHHRGRLLTSRNIQVMPFFPTIMPFAAEKGGKTEEQKPTSKSHILCITFTPFVLNSGRFSPKFEYTVRI